MPVTGQLWYSTEGLDEDALIAYVNSDSNTSTIVVDNNPTVDLQTGFTEDIVFDTAAGLYFVLVSGNEGINAKLLMGQIGSAAAPVEVFEFDPTFAGTENNLALSLHIDPINERLYVGFIDFADFQDSTQGVRQFTYDPTPTGNPTPVTDNGLIYSQTVASIDPSAVGATPLFIPRDFDVDYTRNVMYTSQFTLGDGFETNTIVRIDLDDLGATAVPLLNPALFTLDGDGVDFTTVNGIIQNVEIDVDTDRVYFTTHAEDVEEGGAPGDPEDAIWVVANASTASNATPVKLTLNPGAFSALFTTQDFYPGDIVIDEVNNVLYVESENSNLVGGGITDVILKFQLSVDGLTATLIDVINPGFDQTANIEGLTFNQLAELGPLSPTASVAVEQVNNLDLLTAAPAIDDFESDHLNNATVTIGNSFVGSGDHLFALDGLTERISGTFTGTNITITRTTDGSGNQTLTLTGYDTFANYQTVLNAIGFRADGDNPTNYGNNTTRTVTWQLNDGAAGNPSGTIDGVTTNVRTSTITIEAVNDAPVNTVPGAAPSVNEDTLTALAGFSVSDVDADPANQDIVVTLSVDNGIIDLDTTILGGIIAADVANDGTDTVTITATQNQINATFAGTGLRYQGDLNFNGGDTLTITTNDQGNTGTPGATQDQDQRTITVVAQNDTPDLANVGAAAASTEQTPDFLDTDATVSDVDLDPLNGGNGLYTGASLVIARQGGADAEDSFGFDATGALFTVSGGNLQSGGLTFATFTNVGGTLTLNFTSSGTAATTALVNDVLQHIAYQNTSDAPPASVVLDYTFNDGSPGNGQGGGPAAATDTGSITVNITAVNDAPLLNVAAIPVLNAVDEEAAAPTGAVGTLVSDLVDLNTIGGGLDNVTELDGTSLTGIALTGVDTANGTWFYTTDGGANWLAVGAVSDDSARLLAADANTRLYFRPTTVNFNGVVTNAITFRAWDQSDGGLNGSTADPTPAGGSTAFSTASDTADITVNNINDAPTGIVVQGGGNLSVEEFTINGSANGAVAGAVVAQDPDDTTNFAYTLIDDAAGRFAINSATGEITVVNAILLDTEQNASHDIVVNVMDSGGLSPATDTTFTVNVTNVDPEVVVGDGNANTFVGGPLNDIFYLQGGGDDDVDGGVGNDNFLLGAAFTADERINGGAGFDQVVLEGDYATGFVILDPQTLTNVEVIGFRPGFSYDITTDDATVAAGQTLVVWAAQLPAPDAIFFDGSAETDGAFRMTGGGCDDVLIGGANNDTFTGGPGFDLIDGGAGFDTAVFSGLRSAYTLSDFGAAGVVVSGPDGDDLVTGVERLIFDDVRLNWPPTAGNDFNADGFGDLLWRNTGSGEVITWELDGASGAAVDTYGNISLDWQQFAATDANADGLGDVLWRNSATGQVMSWELDGAGGLVAEVYGAANLVWQSVGAGDFNGDGMGDVLFRNTSTGQVATWELNGSGGFAFDSYGTETLDWKIAGIGDFNNDGFDDILWRNSTNGQVKTWELNGSGGFTSDTYGAANLTRHVFGVGDFNADGFDDILWRSDNGQVATWELDGAGDFGVDFYGAAGSQWSIMHATDSDSDGKDDIIWRNGTTGQVAAWELNGSGGITFRSYGSNTLDWQIFDGNFQFV